MAGPMEDPTGPSRNDWARSVTQPPHSSAAFPSPPGAVTNARAVAWLESQGDRPFFLFMHSFDTQTRQPLEALGYF
jgi:hypothetical protein